jgi:hypothetical protein
VAGERDDEEPRGRDLALDPDAESASEQLPGFLARPEGAPVYHGFVVLGEVDGFRLGTISELGPEPYGDAFVVAPDGSRAGLVWEVGDDRELHEVIGFEPDRWGVWAVEFPRPLSSPEAALRNLELALPRLREKWEQWRGSTLK